MIIERYRSCEFGGSLLFPSTQEIYLIAKDATKELELIHDSIIEGDVGSALRVSEHVPSFKRVLQTDSPESLLHDISSRLTILLDYFTFNIILRLYQQIRVVCCCCWRISGSSLAFLITQTPVDVS